MLDIEGKRGTKIATAIATLFSHTGGAGGGAGQERSSQTLTPRPRRGSSSIQRITYAS
jgi:hypothetical protein